jgi:hypothetical protein
MFAGVQDDLTVGMHMHYHFLYAPPFTPTPFYPHPAIGMLRDKFAKKTKIDNKKAARTGTKSKIMLPPHLPYIGPFTHGMPKETTGIQVAWMGAGMGAHPFGGVGFVVIEGKPAAGFLSSMLGCWCVSPGFDMKLPFVGLDFIMVPGFRLPTVLYGPAPLAMDLFVLLLSIIEDLLDYLISKIPIPWLREIADVAKTALMTGLETAVEAYEQGVRPISACLLKGARYAGYAFVDGMVSWGVGKVLDFGLGKFKGSKTGKWLKDSKLGKWATDSKFGSFVTDFALDIGKGTFKLQAKEFLTSPMKKWTMRTGPDGKQYSEYEKFKSDQKAGKAEFGIGSILEAGATSWGKHANTTSQERFMSNYKSHVMHSSISERKSGKVGMDDYRKFKKFELDQKKGGWKARDDAGQRHFNKFGPGGMTGFNGKHGDLSKTDFKPNKRTEHWEGMKKGGKEMFNKTKESTMNEMFDDFSEDFLEEDSKSRKTFTKQLAKQLFKL